MSQNALLQVQTCLGVFLLWELRPKLDSHTRNSCILNKVLVLVLCKKCGSCWGFLSVTGGECPREGTAVRSWDRAETCAGMKMPTLSYHQFQLSAILLFQALPWNNTPLLSLMEEYRHDGHELHSYFTDFLCSPLKYGLVSVTWPHFGDERDC